MSTRKLGQRNIRKLYKIAGKSIGVVIPIEFICDLKWKEKQKVIIKKSGRKLIIKDWK